MSWYKILKFHLISWCRKFLERQFPHSFVLWSYRLKCLVQWLVSLKVFQFFPNVHLASPKVEQKEQNTMRRVQIRGFFWSYFPVFGINTEAYRVNLPIQSECRNIRTRRNSVLGHFSHSEMGQNWYKDSHQNNRFNLETTLGHNISYIAINSAFIQYDLRFFRQNKRSCATQTPKIG